MDAREREKWYDKFDAKRMVVVLEGLGDDDTDLEIPVKYEVCDVCEGRGTHVNPSIDSHGISEDEFGEDPDFRESYFRGDYDVTCHECGGRNVVPVVDEERAGPELTARVNKYLDEKARYAAECEAERRMGA